MNIYAKTIFLLLIFVTNILNGQSSNIDVQRYINNVKVSDKNDSIQGISDIEILFVKALNSFSLDLINVNENGKGMLVSKVLENDKPVEFIHDNDKLKVHIREAVKNEIRTYSIYYSGIPADGLIISKNKYGDRTFFGDNWPNRAKNWFPCVDHPSDKAFVTFKVTAPSHYQVISNGLLIEETNLNDGNTFYIWNTNVTLPTKVMVIGIAKFAVKYVGDTYNIPVSSWVYPQNKTEGFYDYAQAKSILRFFIDNVGPYPYKKLANVQSTTLWGGMENASNIFYFEASVTGKREHEQTVAHEIAHQWFGDSATETDWPHIWLSEGFATYLTNLYFEKTYGKEVFTNRLKEQRKTVIDFAKNQYTPVVDFETKDYMKLINANSYQKGGWALHMLRKKVGDALFWESIRTYYDTYKYGNASTKDLRRVFETVSGQDLKSFFNQWLYTAGHPELVFENSKEDNILNLKIIQKQQTEHAFVFPLDVKIIYNDNTEELKTLEITKREESFSLPLKTEFREIILDPNTWLLFEVVK